jgi:uncharacterized membrane protein YozB (DUF420 family)
MEKILHQPGFIGTSANFAADTTLVASLLVAILFSVGVLMAVKGRYQIHRWFQTTAAALNVLFVLWMMVLPFRDFVVQDFLGSRSSIFYGVTSVHAFVGFLGLTFGIFVTLRGNELMLKPLKFNNYKLFMRVSYGLYMLATLLGILVYLTWFVNSPNPPTY